MNIKSDWLQRNRMFHSASSLKQAIEKSRENMSAGRRKRFTEWDAMQELQDDMLKSEVESCCEMEREIILRRRIAQIEARHKAFREAQSHRRLEIVAKMLKEQNEQEKRINTAPRNIRHRQVELTGDSAVQTFKSERIKKILDGLTSAEFNTSKKIRRVRAVSADPSKSGLVKEAKDAWKTPTSQGMKHIVDTVMKEDLDHILNDFIDRDSTNTYTHVVGDHWEESGEDETMEGDCELGISEEDNRKDTNKCGKRTQRNRQPTTLEKELLQRSLNRIREHIVQPQIVGHKEFHGPGFRSNPSKIWFKDFEVNSVTKLKVQLTNASFKAITCRYIDMSEGLLDFVSVRYSPPGVVSPGMSFTFEVIFTPKLERDLCGQLNFLAPNGPFSIPFKATTKKYEIAVDSQIVDFGEVVIGETARRQIVLQNTGGKGVHFKFAIEGSHDSLIDKARDLGLNRSEPVHNTEGEQIQCDEHSTEAGTETTGQFAEADEQEASVKGQTVDNLEIHTDYPQEFQCGEPTEGFLEAYSSTKLEIIWRPTTVIPTNEGSEWLLGETESARFVIHFEEPGVEPVHICAQGIPKDLPTWLSTTNILLGICWFDRLYQDSFSINNRTNGALKVTVEMDARIGKHLEILPNMGAVQAHGRLVAQVKFLPRQSLSSDLQELTSGRDSHLGEMDDQLDLSPQFDPDTGVLQVPVIVSVAGQTNVLKLVVSAVVTTSDLHVAPNAIDLGTVELSETVVTRFSITNPGLLPQEFAIVNLPQYADVQPNNGFGTILPEQTMELELLFTPDKVKEFKFRITCKSGIGRIFTTDCVATCVKSPVTLSAHKLVFNPTPLGETSCVQFSISNPRQTIGPDGILRIAKPTAFQFEIMDSGFSHPKTHWSEEVMAKHAQDEEAGPLGSEFLTILPKSDTLEPNQTRSIKVYFSPTLGQYKVKQLAARMQDEYMLLKKRQTMELELQKARQEKKTKKVKPQSGKRRPGTKDVEEKLNFVDAPTVVHITPTDPQSIKNNSKEFMEAELAMLQKYPSNGLELATKIDHQEHCDLHNSPCTTDGNEWPATYAVYRLACFVADGPGFEGWTDNPPTYHVENTVFVELLCPIVRPALRITSPLAVTNRLDFGQVCVGLKKTMHFTVQNISPYDLKLSATPLNPIGPFEFLSSMDRLKLKESVELSVQFAPTYGHTWCSDSFELLAAPLLTEDAQNGNTEQNTWKCPMTVKVTGVCTTPNVELTGSSALQSSTCNAHILHCGSVIAGEFTEQLVQVRNTSEAPVHYAVVVDEAKPRGTCNMSGLPTFHFDPNSGLIQPGSTQSIKVTFSPDHPSDLYHETLVLKLFNQMQNAHTIQVRGCCKSSPMYVRGGDHGDGLGEDDESHNQMNDYIGVDMSLSNEERAASYLTMRLERGRQTSAKDESLPEGMETSQAELHSCSSPWKTLHVGFVKSGNDLSKKAGEFTIENIKDLNTLGFEVEPQKATVDTGVERVIRFRWIPKADVAVGTTVEAVARLTLKADRTTTHRVYLLGVA
ncbi:hypothetical protein CLF_102349 [Clonorchis sinensis]|uniref:Cilia-and flagella-associated protein 74 n=1 Tax=Clonorchis sinensis TaxID=79923 RepID=G7Y7Q6_CLOSI|nr:hypothetical protein CLF_102349 [Clonorchis sinensis]